MDKHELISRLKGLVVELGHVPTREEFITHGGPGSGAFKNAFGTWAVFQRAAGIEPPVEKRRKVDNSVFERDIGQHLAEYRPKIVEPAGGVRELWSKCLFIPDVHAPFANVPLLTDLTAFAREHQPEYIVQLGDMFDMYSAASFAKSQNLFTPREEMQLARGQAEKMWADLRTVCPQAKCYQLRGNHSIRPLKRVLEHFPFGEDWIERMLTELMTFPGVETLADHREELMLPGDVMVHHGYRSQLGQHRDYVLRNFVCGHTHLGGVSFRQAQGRVLFELNAGLAGLQDSKGLAYTNQRETKWTPGWGWLDRWGPRFIPWNQS